MSSQELEQTNKSDQDILKEELEAINEKPELDVTTDEQPLSREEKEEDGKPNVYAEFLSAQWQKNNEEQTAEAKRIIEQNDWVIQTIDGKTETLTYKLLNRSEDVDVKKAQKNWLHMRGLMLKLRGYEEGQFNIKDFINNKHLREAGVTGETTPEDLEDIIQTKLDELYDIRNNVLANAFFNLQEEDIDKYVYKKLTFLIDVAYSNYTSVPY